MSCTCPTETEIRSSFAEYGALVAKAAAAAERERIAAAIEESAPPPPPFPSGTYADAAQAWHDADVEHAHRNAYFAAARIARQEPPA